MVGVVDFGALGCSCVGHKKAIAITPSTDIPRAAFVSIGDIERIVVLADSIVVNGGLVLLPVVRASHAKRSFMNISWKTSTRKKMNLFSTGIMKSSILSRYIPFPT